MADVEAAPPQVATPPAPPPAARRLAARAASALCRFLSLASHAALCALLGAFWTCFVAGAASTAAGWGGSPAAAAVAEEFFHLALFVAFLLFAVTFLLAVALFLHRFVMAQLILRRHGSSRDREARREIGGDATATMAILAARIRGGGDHAEGVDGGGPVRICGAVTVILLLIPMGVGLLIVLFAPARGSWQERLGAMIMDVGFFLVSVVFCFVVFPSVAAMVIAGWAEVREDAAILTYLYVR